MVGRPKLFKEEYFIKWIAFLFRRVFDLNHLACNNNYDIHVINFIPNIHACTSTQILSSLIIRFSSIDK